MGTFNPQKGRNMSFTNRTCLDLFKISICMKSEDLRSFQKPFPCFESVSNFPSIAVTSHLETKLLHWNTKVHDLQSVPNIFPILFLFGISLGLW